MTNPTQKHVVLLAAILLLAAFFIASYHLQRESLWYDEGWTLWAVGDDSPAPSSLGAVVRYPVDSLSQTFSRIRDDVHPPLYYVLLDVWVMLTGESVFAVRLLSTFLGLIALAATYATGARLFDRATGLLAMVVLGTASFFVYYTREARMYTLLIALAALASWLYWRWTEQPTRGRSAVYGLAIALLLYSHYAGALVILGHAIHWLLTRPIRFRAMIWPYLLAILLYAPWMPFLLNQMRLHQARPMAAPLPTDWGLVAALLLILTSGSWGQYALPFILGRALPQMRQHGRALAFVALWLLLTPLALLALNAWIAPLFQMRYTVAILPAGALLMGYGLRYVGLPEFVFSVRGLSGSQRSNSPLHRMERVFRGEVNVALTLFLLGWLAYTQLAMYTEFWPDKPRWDDAVQQMTAARQPLEPAISDINPQSVAAYYDRQYGIHQGITIDLAWRDFLPDEVAAIVGKLDDAPVVWAVMRSDVPSTWDSVALLDAARGIGYRDSVMNVIFYRFDTTADDDLQFRFGDALRYDGRIGYTFAAAVGKAFCPALDLTLTALRPADGPFTASFYLTQGYNQVWAVEEMTVEAAQTDERIALTPCMTLPEDAVPGAYHLRLVITQQGNRLPLIEGPAESDLFWGTELMLAVVTIDG